MTDLYPSAKPNPITVHGVTINLTAGVVTVDVYDLQVHRNDEIEWICPDADFAARFDTECPTDHPGWGAKQNMPSRAKVIVGPRSQAYKYTVFVYPVGQPPITLDPHVIVT